MDEQKDMVYGFKSDSFLSFKNGIDDNGKGKLERKNFETKMSFGNTLLTVFYLIDSLMAELRRMNLKVSREFSVEYLENTSDWQEVVCQQSKRTDVAYVWEGIRGMCVCGCV